MKLNRAWLAAAAAAIVVGSVSAVGFAWSGDESDDADSAATEQVSPSNDDGAMTTDDMVGDSQFGVHHRHHRHHHHHRHHRFFVRHLFWR